MRFRPDKPAVAPVQPVVRPNQPRMINFTGVPEGMGGNTYYGEGLSGIADQRQALAEAAGGGLGLQNVREPFGGAGYLVNVLSNNIRQAQAEAAEDATRQRLSQIMGGIDLAAGPTQEQIQAAYEADPSFGEKLYAQAVAARSKEAWVDLGNGLQKNTVTGETKSTGLEGGGGPKRSDVASFVGRITGETAYEQLANAMPMWNSMQDAVARDTPQSDLNMVIAMAKLFDPTSVVRTEEGEMVRDTAGLPASVMGAFKMLKGDPTARLDAPTRKGMMQEAHSRMAGYTKEWQAKRKFYLDYAARYGFAPEDVPDFAPVQPYEGAVAGEEPAEPEALKPLPYPGDMPEGWTGSWPSKGWWAEASPEEQAQAIKEIDAMRKGGGGATK